MVGDHWTQESDRTAVYYGSTSGPTVVYVSNYTYSNLNRRYLKQTEEQEKAEHADKMRRRDLGYLWKPVMHLRRLRFQVVAPFTRFIPRWSANRFKALT